MTRLILILLAIFLILTIIRNFLRRFKNNPSIKNTTTPNPKININKDKKQDDDDNIVDAKFEEIK